MSKPAIVVRNWLRAAEPDQARLLAKSAKTSVAHLRHVAAGRRNVSAEFAQRLAHASRTLKLPKSLELDQKTLCIACSRCPIAR